MTDKSADWPRIPVYEAFKRVSEFLEKTQPGRLIDWVSIAVEVETDDGGNEKAVEDGRMIVEWDRGVEGAVSELRRSLLDFCTITGVRPRNLRNPWAPNSYRGISEVEDYEHDISIAEFHQWASAYGFDPVRDDRSGEGLTQMKKAAIVEKFGRCWESVVNDFSEASRNGINECRVPGREGWYYLEKVERWAKENGKMTYNDLAPTSTGPLMANLPGRQNKIK